MLKVPYYNFFQLLWFLQKSEKLSKFPKTAYLKMFELCDRVIFQDF